MIERREFLKKVALLAGVMGGGALLPTDGKAADQEIGIAVVEGENPNAQVREAIRLLGGIERFVRRGDRVVLLPNPQGTGVRRRIGFSSYRGNQTRGLGREGL